MPGLHRSRESYRKSVVVRWLQPAGETPPGSPVSEDYGSSGNAFNGRVKGVQLAIADAAENSDHLVTPEDAVRLAMARQ